MMPSKGIDLNALTDQYSDALIMYEGGVFLGHVNTTTVTREIDGSEAIELTIQTRDLLTLDPSRATSDVAIGVLRKLRRKAIEHEDKESENLISGALTLLEL